MTDLANDDAKRAHRAIWGLVSTPERAVLALQGRLRPVSERDDKRLAPLLADLDSAQFAVREAAATKLAQEKELAVPALRRLLAGKPSLELCRRAEALLAQTEGRAISSPEWLRLLRGIEALEEIGTQPARDLLAELAGGENCRICRPLPGSQRRIRESRPAEARSFPSGAKTTEWTPPA